MALKRRSKAEAGFNMSSMTDIVFLLLIFFMLTSTVVHPNAIKLMLPQSKQQTSAKPITRVTIDKELNYYVASGNEKERPVSFEEIEPFLQQQVLDEPDMYVALYADETIPYGEVVKVLNIANTNKFKLVIATRPQK
ncbi:MAG: biopolymer transporter ExbD [Paludibacteraceae bacterium]|nr:biopolymer transporter ExbD [Paludibacteraceae bacterium]MBP5481673.1 biopolymer transporter ExbD [Paludibacteraceae bacterium]MBR3519200.1 biopolymer transporter ExbD [Paludibacteraceae bacterium]MCR5498747.1 biopolymer transporter ExbD [Paludibacteraceae bacterium]